MRRSGPYKALVQDENDDDDEEEGFLNSENNFLLKQPDEILVKEFTSSITSSVKPKKSNNLLLPDDLNGNNFAGIELRSRNLKSAFDGQSSTSNYADNVVFIERKIQKSDSLRNLALQYGVSVAELKRANGIISDQEFYGKDVLKIPVQKYGLHHNENENSSQYQQQCSSASNVDLLTDDLEFGGEFVDLNIHGIDKIDNPNTASRSQSADRENMPPKLFLKSVDDSVKKIKTAQQELMDRQKSANTDDDEDSPEQDRLANTGIAIATRPVKNSWLTRNISHFVVVVLVIFLIIIIPVCVLLYKFLAAVTNSEQN